MDKRNLKFLSQIFASHRTAQADPAMQILWVILN
jgi:hypothetical protein